MSCHKCLLLLQNYRFKSNLFNLQLSTYFGSKYKFASSFCATDHAHKLDSFENIQVSKYVQPFINSSVDEILSAVNNKSTSVSESVSMLKALRVYALFRGINPDAFKEDKQFKILCEIFQVKCMKIAPNLLISGLRSLLEVGVSPNAPCVVSAEESIIQNLDKFSVFNMICCLYFHRKFRETDLQKKVVSSLIKGIQEKIPGITSSDILMLIPVLNLFNDEYKKKLEHRIIDLIPSLYVHEMGKILITLSENSLRNIFILNAIAFHMRHKNERPNFKEVIDMLYAVKKLNFCDPLLLTYLCNKALPAIPFVEQPSLISGLLTICGYLKWEDRGIIDACGEWIVKHMDSCRMKEFVAYILSAAALNFATSKVEKISALLLPHLTLENVKSPDVWLDVVWSLAVLKYVDKKMLQLVLSKEFCQQLTDESNSETVSNKLKLMNLKAVLKMHHPECIFRCDLFLEPISVTHSTDIENGRKHVINVLSNFVPKHKYLCTSQNTEMGVFIDAEFIMAKTVKPLPLEKYGVLSDLKHNTKPLPEGAKRISLLVLFHKDFTLNKHSLTGCNALAVRLLEAHGYTVVLIPFDEFMENKTEVQKARFLMQQINQSMRRKTTD